MCVCMCVCVCVVCVCVCVCGVCVCVCVVCVCVCVCVAVLWCITGLNSMDMTVLQYKTQCIRYIGLPVTNVAHEICVQLLSILSLHKYIYKCLPVCCHGDINPF